MRTELAAAGLLAIARAEDGVRWLVPLPLDESECSDCGNVFPEIHFMETEALKEEEVKFNNISPPPPLPPPPGEFTGNGLPADAALVRFLVGHGAFPGVAAELAGQLLARMSRDEAEVYSLALLRAAEDSRDARSGQIDAERVTGRWIARLRSGVRPPAWAVAEAAQALALVGDASAKDALATEEGEDWPGDAVEEVEEVAAEVVEAEERPWSVSGGRACSHRELWEMALSHLRLQLPADTFDGWLRGTTCTGTDGSGRTLVVRVADRCAVDWLTVRLRRMVLRTLEGITGRDDLEVRFEEG